MTLHHLLDLRRLILTLAVAATSVTLINSLHAIYAVQRAELISGALGANRVYASKLAEISDNFLHSAQTQLAYSAGLLAPLMKNDAALANEAKRLLSQTESFNSVVIVNADGVIISASPETLPVKGRKLVTPSERQSLDAKRPLVTEPFVSPSGNYVISISQPIRAADGAYLGYVAGSIYLEAANILNDILGKHYHDDGSYIYVVDRSKTLIYHPEKHRIGEKISGNPMIDAVVLGKSGAHEATNSKGTAMLAGFAPIARSGWGVVAQRPRESTLAGLDHHVLNVLAKILPIGLLTLILIWLTAGSISKPLRQLARSAGTMDSGNSEATISGTRSWYFEAEQLKRALLKGVRLMHEKINQLRLDSSTDPMTGLLNRRGLQEILERYEASGQSFSAITLDIDHFKNVNDTFGHDVGDSVIRKLAELMRTSARKDDALCRVGGEEFLLVLPDTDLSIAKEVAERLRNHVAEHPIPIVGSITISLGIAHRPGSADTIESVLKLADHALYTAKRTGRNQTVAA